MKPEQTPRTDSHAQLLAEGYVYDDATDSYRKDGGPWRSRQLAMAILRWERYLAARKQRARGKP